MTHKNMTPKRLKEFLIKNEACNSAIKWADGKSLEEAWNACERSDWMIWYLTKKGVEEKTMRLLAVALVREVQHLMNDTRSINALDVAEKFANGEATKDELDSARRDAEAAARAAAEAAARRDAWTAAAAAEAAAAAAEAAARAAAEAAARRDAWTAAAAAEAAAAAAEAAARAAAEAAARRDAWTAAAAAEAASWASMASWRDAEQKKQCDIIRKFISYEDLLA